MSVTAKFSRVFWLIPSLTLASLMLGVHYFYGITPELFLVLIPSLISTVAVLLLVWERLRGSLRRDFRWFHKYVLFKLYDGLGPNMNLYFIQKKDFKRLRDDLEEYGRSMGLRLYPGKLPEMIDKLLELHEDFSPKLKEIEEWGKKELRSHYSFFTFLYYLGIQPVIYTFPSVPVEEAFKDTAQELSQIQPELVEGAKDLLQKMRETRAQIYNSLDDFIKDNKLRLEPKPSYVGYPRY